MPSPATTELILFASVTVAQITLRAAELGQLFGRILNGTVYVGVGAELFGERPLVRTARDRHGLESHLYRELHSEVPQTADAKNCDEIAGARAAVA